MNKVLLSAFVLLFSASAFASKARVNSLQGANHLVDTQTVFTVPSHLLLLNPYLTFEMGTAGTDAEGGIMRNVGAAKMLVYLGHQNTTGVDQLTDVRTGNSFLDQNNPVEVLYATGNMGFGASLSHVENKTAGTKETTIVGKWGMNLDNESWVYAHLNAFSTAQDATSNTMNAYPWLKLGGAKAMPSKLRFFGELNAGMMKYEPATGSDVDIRDVSVNAGVEDRSLKTDAADVYYGIKASFNSRDVDTGDDSQAYALPAFIGIEHATTTWATFRASVSQNILVGKTNDEATPSESGVPKNTTVAGGLGLKWNSLVVDGTLTAASNGNLNGSTFLSQVSATYNF